MWLKIASLFEGSYVPENPKEDAQLRELAFWRWVAYEGYEGKIQSNLSRFSVI